MTKTSTKELELRIAKNNESNEIQEIENAPND